MSPKRTAVLLLIAIALGAYIWFYEKPRMDAESAPARLLAVEPDEIDAITLTYRQSETIRVERTGDGWNMTAPVETDADDVAVDRLLTQITNAEVERRVPSDEIEALEVYGLDGDGDQARITLELEDGSTLPDIVVGRTTPVGFQAFARIDGSDEIVVTPLIFHSGVKKTPFDLREKKLFSVDPSATVAIELLRDGETIRLERRGDLWRIVEPVDEAADDGTINGMLAALNAIQAAEFYSTEDDIPGPGLADTVLRVDVEAGGGGTAGFELGERIAGPPSGYPLRRTGDATLARVDEATLVRFDKDVNALRDKSLFDCEADRIVEVRFDRADGESFSLAAGEDGGWRVIPSPDVALAREGVIKRARGGLASLSGASVVAERAETGEELAAYGLDAPAVEVTISETGGEPCGRALAAVKTGADGEDTHYVKRADSPVVMSIPSYHFSRLDARRDDFIALPSQAEE